MGFKLIQDIHDQADTNDSGIREFEDYLDISSQNYENFKPINQFHNEYEQFPTVYYENTLEEPKEEKEKKKDKRDSSSSDKSSSSSSGSSSASGSSEGASSSSGPTGAESSVGAATGASSSAALANASASQILSTTFVAMVAVTAVVVPIIENADLEVDLDVDYNAGILTYMIELINASEESDYYAVVMEGQTVILQQQIFDNYQSNTITDLRNSQEHRVEVRTGTPPLLVVASEVIPATPSWAEWGHLTVDYNSIDYGVYFHGDSGEAVLKLTDTNSGETLYTKELVDGLNSDVIGGLFSSHLYTLTVETETEVLLFKDIQTEYRDISWNHLTVIDNVIDYGVEVNLGDVEVTISLYDPSTSSVIYLMDLTSGYNADVIRDLEYNHSYELSVASVDETFLFETVITDSEPITVTVGHLTPKDNTIDYELIVSGEGKTVTLDLYDTAGGPSLYTITITSGSNTGIIESLDYSHSYLLTVSSASKTYLSESVTTEAEPTKVTLDSLTSTETTVEYKVTVTGNRDVATVYLKDPTSGETLYTKELTVGTNTAVIEDLETGHTYQFTVSSKTATYVSKEIATGSHPVEVTLNHLTPSDNTIDYEVTVTGNSEVVTAYLYDADGEVVYSKELSEGTNPDTIKGLEYDYAYQFTISSETQIYVSEEVIIIASIIVESLEADGLIINYVMTVHGTEDATITLYRAEDDVQIESATLPAGKTTEGTFIGTDDLPIEPNKVYYVKGYIGENEYDLGSVRPESKVVTQELTAEGHIVTYKIEVYKSAGSELELYIYDEDGDPLSGTPIKYTITEDSEIIEDSVGEEDPYVPWDQKITLEAKMDGETYEIGEIDIVDGVVATFEADLNSILYDITVYDNYYIYGPYIIFTNAADMEDSEELHLQKSDDGKYSGTVTSIDDFTFKWGTTYTIEVVNGGAVYYQDPVTIPARVNGTLTSNGNEIAYDITILEAESVDLHFYADQLDGFWLEGLQVDPDTNKITGTVQNNGDDVTIEWGVEYHVEVSVPDDEEYYEVGDVSIESFNVTITDISTTESAVHATVTLNMKKYNGVTVALYMDEDCTKEVQGSSRTPMGSSLTYECSDLEYGKTYYLGVMYNEERKVYSEVSTAKADSDIIITGVSGLKYTSTDKALVTKTGNDEQTVQYSIDGGTVWSESIPEFTDAGWYTVTFKAEATTHYNALAEDSVQVLVVKAPSDIVFVAASNLTYADLGSAMIVKTAGNQEQEVKYSTNGTTWVDDIPTVTAVGDFYVYYKAASSTNYETLAEVQVSVVVSKATASITITEGQSFDYTGQTHELATTDKVGTGAVTFAYYDAATGGEAISSPVSAGAYWATATVAADSNYNEFTTNRVSFTINKIIQSVSANAITIESGESKSVSNYISGLKESPSMSYSVTSGSSVSVDATGKLTWLAGGVSTVKASYAETTNYQAGSVNVTVTAKAAAYVEGLPDSFSLLSTGAAQYLVTSDDYTKVVGGTISFYGSNSALTTSILKELTDDDWDAVNNVTRTNTGTYYVYYKITSNDSSYTSLGPNETQVVMVTITSNSLVVETTGSPQYNGESAVTATITFNMSLSARYSCKIYHWENTGGWSECDSDYCGVDKTTQGQATVSYSNLNTGENRFGIQIIYNGVGTSLQKAIYVPDWPSYEQPRQSPSWTDLPGPLS